MEQPFLFSNPSESDGFIAKWKRKTLTDVSLRLDAATAAAAAAATAAPRVGADASSKAYATLETTVKSTVETTFVKKLKNIRKREEKVACK